MSDHFEPLKHLNNPEESAKNLRKAMKGLGTDESRIIQEICNHTKAERQEIRKYYENKYGKNLEDKLKSELSGNFLKALLGLLHPTDEYEAICLRDSISLSNNILFNDDDAIIQFICTKTNEEIKHLAATYKRLFDLDLVKDIESNVSGTLGQLLALLARGDARDTSETVNEKLAKHDAQELYDAGAKQSISNQQKFIHILCTRSYSQLALTFYYYYQLASCTLENSIEREMTSKLKHGLIAIIKSNENLPRYLATQINESLRGLGTNEKDLHRILVWRSEIDLDKIKYEYQLMYNRCLYNDVKHDTSGDYRKLLLTLIGKD